MNTTNLSSNKTTESELGIIKGNSATNLKWSSILQKRNADDNTCERERIPAGSIGPERPEAQPNQHQKVL